MTVYAFIPDSRKGEAEEPVLYLTDFCRGKTVIEITQNGVTKRGYIKREAGRKFPLLKGLTRVRFDSLLFIGRHNNLMQWTYLTGR
ncbi:Uncharacterised protein [Raoultella terrigena]|uniref:Uncharacterized protein n=1 Tax=Raoultella terrigena TaxID=577 RepID=A0A4U9DD29_RAOTE|nr:Uncharacterised protein [Raoultella terrigena]